MIVRMCQDYHTASLQFVHFLEGYVWRIQIYGM